MNAPHRVLLVDDEPRVVAGLQRLLRPHRASWEVQIATSGPEALEKMAGVEFDVIVTDMRMPVMDGARLLELVRERHPATMRIVLSGQTDAEAAIRVLPFAHQFLNKPTPPEPLLEALRRVLRLRTEIADSAVRSAIVAVDALPALPAVCCELVKMLADESCNAGAIAKVVETDGAIVAKLLQVVNSAFFGSPRRIASVTDAVTYLGMEPLKHVVTSVALVTNLPVRATRFDVARYQEHSYAVARAAMFLTADPSLGANAFAAGLLHDVGQLVMASRMPELLDRILLRAETEGRPFEEVELGEGSPGHARIGACLLELWGLPFEIVEAVLDQMHLPAEGQSGGGAGDLVRRAHRHVSSPQSGCAA